MKELGEYLKETREKNHVEIDETATDLNINVNVIKNIENGNTRAFRDMLELKEYVKEYAKYLGLDPEKVVDEFNDFLFEHTSKINLSDILEAEKRIEKSKKTISPYTKIKKKKINGNYVKFFLIFLIIFLIVFFLIRKIIESRDDNINRELMSSFEVRGD